MTEAVIVRSVTRGLCRTVVKAASVSGYLVSKYSTGFVRIWLNCKSGSRGFYKSSYKGSCKEQADKAYHNVEYWLTTSVLSYLVSYQLLSQLCR